MVQEVCFQCTNHSGCREGASGTGCSSSDCSKGRERHPQEKANSGICFSIIQQWSESQSEILGLRSVETASREVGGIMLAITGATKLYYVSGFTDMRSGKYTLANVVRNSFHRNPYNGDGYVFSSKDGKKVKILIYKQSLYRLYDLSYDGDCRFMKIENEDGSPLEPCTQLEWKYLVALINCPVRSKIRIYG